MKMRTVCFFVLFFAPVVFSQAALETLLGVDVLKWVIPHNPINSRPPKHQLLDSDRLPLCWDDSSRITLQVWGRPHLKRTGENALRYAEYGQSLCANTKANSALGFATEIKRAQSKLYFQNGRFVFDSDRNGQGFAQAMRFEVAPHTQAMRFCTCPWN